MSDLQITAISVEGLGTQVQHITHFWGPGIAGAKPKQEAVEDLWYRRHTFFVQPPGERRADVEPVPAHPPGLISSNMLGVHHKPYLRTMPDGRRDNNLLSLPRLTAPGVNSLASVLYGKR